jgi:hypothetical protein
VNFIPSYAANTYEIWRNYDHDLVDQDLGLASAVGYNTVRLFLNYAAYKELGPRMIQEVEDTVRLCAKHHLRAVIVLFDSCGVRPREDTKWMTASKAYDLFQSSVRFDPAQKALMQHLFDHYVHGFGANTMVPVASDSSMMALLYQKWVPTPGNDLLAPESYRPLEEYVDTVVGSLKDNPAVLLWDFMNEPEWASEGLLISAPMKVTRDAFLQHFHDHLRKQFPSEILTIGWARLEDAEEYSNLSDVVTFHVYGDPEVIQSGIDKAQAFGRSSGKTVLITETLANWDFGSPDFGSMATDENQLAHYKKVLPVLVKSPIGWIAWGLVISPDFDPFTDIFYPDGHPRPAAVFLEQTLKGARMSDSDWRSVGENR